MNFEHPLFLFGVLPLAVCGWLYWKRNVSVQEKKRLPPLLASLFLLLIALANPYWDSMPEKKAVKGVDLLLVIDVSQSMFCPADPGLRRIDQARNFLRTLLPRFSGSPMAVVYFAGDAQIGCPLTTDSGAVELFLDSITPGMTARPGTAAAPLESVLEHLVGSRNSVPLEDSRKQLVLLFSDGEFFDSHQGLASWFARRNEPRGFTFLCGKGRSPVPKYDLSGPYPGAFSEVHPEVLQTIASAANGSFFSLNDQPSEQITNRISALVHEIIAWGEPVPRYRFYIFLLLSFVCLLGYQFLPLLARFYMPPEAVTVAVLCLCLVSASAKGPGVQIKLYDSALEDMKQNRYDQALQKLHLLEQEGTSEQVEVAIGNVYVFQKKFDQATESYKKVLEWNPANDLARWNWEVALKRKSHPREPEKKEQPSPPKELPDETKALLKYFDQLEKEQMRLTNSINANTSSFAW